MRKFNECPLAITTFDGSHSPYHPSVLFIREGWNGYRYWMAQTPFSPKCKPYRDRFECPQIHYSNDGINWESRGVAIDDLTTEEVKDKDFFSDPHLVIRDNVLECWYRITHRHGGNSTADVSLVRRRSVDGITWSEREYLAPDLMNGRHSLGTMIVSPAVIWEDDRYKMWFVDSESHNGLRNIRYSESRDGFAWSKSPQIITLREECNPWHIDVEKIENKYFLTIYDFKDLLLYVSEDGLSYDKQKVILKRGMSKGSYYYDLYRASLVKAESSYRLYFSASDLKRTYIGLMEGIAPTDMKVVNPAKRGFRSLFQTIVEEVLPRIFMSIKFRLMH